MQRKALAAALYLLLFVPFAVFFVDDGLPGPFSTIVAVLIIVASPIVGHIIGRLSALMLPLIPWTAALILVAIAPADDFGEVTRVGSMILWTCVFLFLAGLVMVGVLVANRAGEGPNEPTGSENPTT